MRSLTLLSQFLRVFLPTLIEYLLLPFACHSVHVSLLSQCVNEVYHEPEAASCVSGIIWHVYLHLW